jgi:aspartate kinase
MARIVRKYGGTSVANIERIRAVAAKIEERARLGSELIIVVSARAGVTNDLLKRAGEVSKKPDPACLDALLGTGECETAAMLAIILNDIGVHAVFRNARIVNVSGGDVENWLKNGQVVLVTGFQGVDANMCPTALGRGGLT